jgi:hypothetical protein
LNYIEAIQEAIGKGYKCKAKHVKTAIVNERKDGQAIWLGKVEVFELEGHPKAKRAYGWGYEETPGKTEFVTVLEIPPVVSPETAVRAYLVEKFK